MDMSLDLHRTIPATVTHAAPHIKHAAVMAAPVIKSGVSMLTLAISNLSTAVIVGGLAWYVRGRGMAGVKIDIDNIKMDLANLKSKFSASPATV